MDDLIMRAKGGIKKPRKNTKKAMKKGGDWKKTLMNVAHEVAPALEKGYNTVMNVAKMGMGGEVYYDPRYYYDPQYYDYYGMGLNDYPYPYYQVGAYGVPENIWKNPNWRGEWEGQFKDYRGAYYNYYGNPSVNYNSPREEVAGSVLGDVEKLVSNKRVQNYAKDGVKEAKKLLGLGVKEDILKLMKDGKKMVGMGKKMNKKDMEKMKNKPKRKMTEYNKFVKKVIDNGGTMKDAAKLWKEMK